MIDRGMFQNPNILDVNSGGMTLERELHRSGHDGAATVMSVDMLPWMHEEGRAALAKDNGGKAGFPACATADPQEIHRKIQNKEIIGPFAAGILRNLAQCNYVQSANIMHERAKVLHSIVKSVEMDGRIVITLPRTACTPEEFNHFVLETLPLFGCIVENDGWHGIARSQDNEDDAQSQSYCVVAIKAAELNEEEIRTQLKAEHFRFTHHAAWAETADGTRVMNAMRKSRLPIPLRHEAYKLGNRDLRSANHPESGVRKTQVEHLRVLENAVRDVRSLARNKTEWKALSPKRNVLVNKRILYHPELSKTFQRPTFSLKAHAGQLFFPFESQWNGLFSEAETTET
ncbi:hypothetical protein HZA87_03150 [Candidatus Uhrbacteria bacterium]|nr:hypothetical protein [Candidatus Uhrbacteria bacterium]